MSASPTSFEEWAEAQAAALRAEQSLARKAADHAAGKGPAPAAQDIQTAVLLRNRASALLMAVISEGSKADLASWAGMSARSGPGTGSSGDAHNSH